jgi:hypothetical protein
VDTIFEGQACRLTVQQPEKFEFVINLKADQRARLNYAADAASPRRYGDKIAIIFAALHESAIGPKQPPASALQMSAFGGKADIGLTADRTWRTAASSAKI